MFLVCLHLHKGLRLRLSCCYFGILSFRAPELQLLLFLVPPPLLSRRRCCDSRGPGGFSRRAQVGRFPERGKRG